MPLITGKSKEAFSKNVEVEMDAGKPQKQAVAIAYAQKRKAEKMQRKWRGGEIEKPMVVEYESAPIPPVETSEKEVEMEAQEHGAEHIHDEFCEEGCDLDEMPMSCDEEVSPQSFGSALKNRRFSK